jgi:hypothetical protein
LLSKEALERYYSNLLYGNGGFQTDEEELEALNTIKKDLERKEKLEKAIEILKPILDIYAGEGKGYIDCCVENPIITFDLYKDKEFKLYNLLKEVLDNDK